MAKLHWITPLKQKNAAVTFGMPWAKGDLQKGEGVSFSAAEGGPMAVQTKNTAYWPDGSVKWTAHSAFLPTKGEYLIEKGEPAMPESVLTARQDKAGAVAIQSDRISCLIEPGGTLFSGLALSGGGAKPISARLVAMVENVKAEGAVTTTSVSRLEGVTKSIILEESGPLRAVVKVSGTHQGCGRELFPFTLRLYFYQGSDQVRIVHTFVFDADESEDFLKGIAVELNFSAAGELYNRHVAFAGDTGLFYEGIKGMYSGGGSYQRGQSKRKPLNMEERRKIYEIQQLEGQFVDFDREAQPEFAAVVDDNASFGNFRLSQDSCDHYSITKNTEEGCAYITAMQGNRSGGSAFFGSSAGIFAASVRDFWQKSPMALELTNAKGENPSMTLWLCSPYAQAMDFRAYDVQGHKFSYGGVVNEPNGIANTNEIAIKLFEVMPGKQAILDFSADSQLDALLVADTKIYEEAGAFGSYWHRQKEASFLHLENALVNLTKYYIDEVERRKWYGFWDFGDVMHTYDPVRHCWRYDVGGYAWQNTELCNTYAHWLVFMRTGDYSIYRFARAMSRHCSEVDTYHAGPFAMFGSRHNVRHWGCGSKEVRISMAGHHRFFYYLTADERMGDVLDEVKDADFATLNRDPMRSYFEIHPGYSHVRVGPDWTAFLSNWMTRWERFEDEKYRDKLLTSVESVLSAPLGLSSGSTFHYDPTTGIMHYMEDPQNPTGHTHLGNGNYQQHMVIAFGGAEIWFELADLLDGNADIGFRFRDSLALFGELYAMTPQQRQEKTGGLFNEENDEAWGHPGFATRMMAYAGLRLGNGEYMQKAVDNLPAVNFRDPAPVIDEKGELIYTDVPKADSPTAVKEVPGISTNTASQWSLNFIETSRLYEQKKGKGR